MRSGSLLTKLETQGSVKNVESNAIRRKQRVTKIYSHIEKKHLGFAKEITSGTSRVNFEIPPEVINLYGWLELIVVTNQPFTIVENSVYAKHTKLKPVSRPTIMKYMDLITKRVEKSIQEILPPKFGIIIDGWTESGTATNYLAVFGAIPQKRGRERTEPLLACSPLSDEADFLAESQKHFIEFTLSVFNRTISSFLFWNHIVSN